MKSNLELFVDRIRINHFLTRQLNDQAKQLNISRETFIVGMVAHALLTYNPKLYNISCIAKTTGYSRKTTAHALQALCNKALFIATPKTDVKTGTNMPNPSPLFVNLVDVLLTNFKNCKLSIVPLNDCTSTAQICISYFNSK